MRSNSKGRNNCNNGMISYPLGVYENQALLIAPQHINGTHPFSLDRYDVIIQFIINYISSCGLHGSCWKQIISAINQISNHQNKSKYAETNMNDNGNTPIKANKKKQRRHSVSAKQFDPYSLCSFWHSFHDENNYHSHSHKSHESGTYYAFLLNEFISYLKLIHQTSNHPLPFTLYLIDKRIECGALTSNNNNDNEDRSLTLTQFGVHYPCMQQRSVMSFDDFYVRYNKFKSLQSKNNTNTSASPNKSLNDRLLSICFMCDIYLVSNVSLRRRYLGYTAVLPEISLQINSSSNHAYRSSHSGLRYCILEKLGRAGIDGLLQTDLLSELNTHSKSLFTAIKHLQHLGLIVIETDLRFSNCNHLWLTMFRFRSNIRTFAIDTMKHKHIDNKELLQLFGYNEYFMDNKQIIYNAEDEEEEDDGRLREYEHHKQVMNELHEMYKQSLIPSSHALYCYNKKIGVNIDTKIRFIDEYVVPQLLNVITDDKYKELGVIMKDLKDYIKTMDFTYSLPLNEIFTQIKWEEIEERLKKLPQLEIHRVFSDESTQIFRTFRIKSNVDGIEDDDDKDKHNMCNKRYIDLGLNQQIYRLIYNSGTNGILATTLYNTLCIKPKEGHKRIKACSKTYDIITVTEHNDKSKPKRLFAQIFYDKLQETSMPQRQSVMSRFNQRLDLLRTCLNDNNGVASAIELRRYIKTKDETFNGDTMLLDTKTFNRLTDKLGTYNEIKIIHYKVNNPNKLNKIKTHSVILNYEFAADDPDIIRLAKAAIHRSTTQNSHILSKSNLITKVYKHQITPKKREKVKKNTSLNIKKRRFSEIGDYSEDERPKKRQKRNEYDHKPLQHALYCSYYGYIRPTMARVRLLHEYLLQYKKNEDMGLIEDIEYDESGLIASPCSSPPHTPKTRTPTPSIASPTYPKFNEYNAHKIGHEHNRNLTTTSPYHRLYNVDRLRYHNHYVLPSLTVQDDMINTLQPLRRNQSDIRNTKPNKKTLRRSPFINILKTFPFKLFLQIIGGDATIPHINDDRFWNIRICNLRKEMYAVIMDISDCRTMRLCRLIDQLKKLELLEFVKNPYHDMMMNQIEIKDHMIDIDDEDEDDDIKEIKKKKPKKKKKKKKKTKKKKMASKKKKKKKKEKEEEFGPPQIEIIDLGFLEIDENQNKYPNYKIKKAKPSEIIAIHSTQITMDNISMFHSSITGGREWNLTSNEKIDTFWKEFKKEVHIILEKYPQLSTAKRIGRNTKEKKEEKERKDDDNNENKKKNKNNNNNVIKYYRFRYDDEEDEECDESRKKTAASTVQSLFNARPIIISEYPIDEFPRLYAVHEWDIKRVSPQKQWQIMHRYNDIDITTNNVKILYNEMQCFARTICVSLEKMLSFVAYNRYPWLRDNYEYMRFSFVFETPTQEYIDEQLTKEERDNIQCIQQKQIVNANPKGIEFKFGTSANENENKEKNNTENVDDHDESENVDANANTNGNALQFVVSLKWSKEEDVTLMQCFSSWRNTLAPNALVDHTVFLKYAHKHLRHRLHRTNEQITRRWRVIRNSFHSETSLDVNNANGSNLDELERLCLHCTLYTSLLNIYRMSFISGHSEARLNQHFANLFQALISDNFSEVEAQNMRQALFNGNYFVVRQRNDFSRLPRYDLPSALYSFIEKPPLIVHKYNTKRRQISKEKHKDENVIFHINKLGTKQCLNTVSFRDVMHEMTRDVFSDPFDCNFNMSSHDDILGFEALPIISLNNELQIQSSDVCLEKRLKPMPSTDVFEILDIDTFAIINDCYSEILREECDEYDVINNEEDAIRFVDQYKVLCDDDHDEVLCDLILDLSSASGGIAMDSSLFCNLQILDYFGSRSAGSAWSVCNRNYLLSNIRYLYNRFCVLWINEFTMIKLISVQLLQDDPKLAYFCVFPYEYDPNEWKNDVPKKRAMRQRKHGITFISNFDECCVCNPWITNGDANRPQIDDELVFRIKEAVLSIIFDRPGIDLFCLYYNYIIKYILTPFQLSQICQSLSNEMKIKIVRKNIEKHNTKTNNTHFKSKYRFFVTL